MESEEEQTPIESPSDLIDTIDWDVHINKPKKAWKLARTLEDNKTVQFITPEKIYEIAMKYSNPRDRCLFILEYITAGRVSELVRFQRIKWGKKKVRIINYPGKNKPIIRWVQNSKDRRLVGELKESIKKEDLYVDKVGGRSMLVIKMRNLKNKQRGDQVKQIPLPTDIELNNKFAKIIDTYWQTVEPEGELFEMNKRRAAQIISKSGFHPHFLRKLRLTHLVKYHNFSDQKLKKFAGWTDSRPAKSYIQLSWEDLAMSM
jgi:integrase